MSDAESLPLRVQLVAHHRRDLAAGVSGATHQLGRALSQAGCEVSYFEFDEAFGAASGNRLAAMIRFPWKVASHLARSAQSLDVIDATTGDAWVWCARGRTGGNRTALVSRAHGLEHAVDADLRRRASLGEAHLSRKYPVYHGGYRLWEVRRSLECADTCVMLNETDRQFAETELHIPRAKLRVIANGVDDSLLDANQRAIVRSEGPIALVFIGSWIPRKGIAAIADAMSELVRRNAPFKLLLLGTGGSEREVLASFSREAAACVRVVPRFEPAQLGNLLHDSEVLLHPSWTEGFSLALAEGMACGLAPIATRAGGAATLVRNGDTGVLLEDGSGVELAEAIERIAAERAALVGMRNRARNVARELRWSGIAEQTIGVYRDAISRRTGRAA